MLFLFYLFIYLFKCLHPYKHEVKSDHTPHDYFKWEHLLRLMKTVLPDIHIQYMYICICKYIYIYIHQTHQQTCEQRYSWTLRAEVCKVISANGPKPGSCHAPLTQLSNSTTLDFTSLSSLSSYNTHTLDTDRHTRHCYTSFDGWQHIELCSSAKSAPPSQQSKVCSDSDQTELYCSGTNGGIDHAQKRLKNIMKPQNVSWMTAGAPRLLPAEYKLHRYWHIVLTPCWSSSVLQILPKKLELLSNYLWVTWDVWFFF